MARIRTVKPELFRHHQLFEAEVETGFPLRIAFAGLFTACDREGRFKWEPEELKLDCLPFDDIDFSRVLHALVTRGFVIKYASQGRDYGVIPSFTRHQVINNRERDSELPDPAQSTVITSELEACPTRAPRDTEKNKGKGREGKGREGIKEGALTGSKENDDVTAMVEIWNAFAAENDMSKVQSITKPRISSAKARLKECGGLDGWRDAIQKVRESPYWMGDNNNGFKATFDSLIRPKNFTKLMEDGFKDRSPPKPENELLKTIRSYRDDA